MSDNDCHYVKHAQSAVDAAQVTLMGALHFRDQLAAKDAEISELRRVAGDWAKAYAYVTDILPHDPRNFARDPVCPMNLAEQDRHRVDVLRGERDEARECVGRLFPLAGMWVDQLSHEAKQPMTGSKARKLAAELDEARAALAATPEHLR